MQSGYFGTALIAGNAVSAVGSEIIDNQVGNPQMWVISKVVGAT